MGNNDDIFMARYSAFNPYRVLHSDMGYQKPIGFGDAIAKSLYYGMKPIFTWTGANSREYPTGGVFNLEFSPEGSLLVAACEKRTIEIFDPLTYRRTHSVVGAHMDCVNCVKFLDARMFATCSDDTTIALWDVRNLKKKIRSLFGHSKWVKNIEFSVKDKLLVTSGLDGSIYTWDINSYTESNLVYQRVFHTSSLMRCRLSQDARQMVMCTTGGLIVIIHDLNLDTLAHDLHGFKPNLYRLMQMSHQLIPIAATYDHLFDVNRKENRVEFISDFPEGNDAEVVSALQIHPQGWSALSRNISHDDRSEWTCIHDIQPADSSTKSTRDPSPPRAAAPRRAPRPRPRARPRPRPYRAARPPGAAPDPPRAPAAEEDGDSSSSSSDEREPPRPRVALVGIEAMQRVSGGPMVLRNGRRIAMDPGAVGRAVLLNRDSPLLVAAAASGVVAADGAAAAGGGAAAAGDGAAAADGGAAAAGSGAGPSHGRMHSFPAQRVIANNAAADAAVSRLGRGMQNDVWEASITLKQHRLLQEIYSRGQIRPNFNMQRITGVNTGITPPQRNAATSDLPPVRLAPSTSGHSPRDCISEEADCKHYIKQNKERLLYYIEETNEGKGFIKELCYSSDGRIVCSPFGRGMRLLALNDNCSELCHCVTEHCLPRPMAEVGQSLGHHQDLVVSSKFSPRYPLLVTGCLEGRIVWYQPYSGEM